MRLVILLAIFGFRLNAQVVPAEPALKGHIRHVREQIKNAGDSTFAPVQTTRYDRSGHIAEIVYFDPYASPPRLRGRQLYRENSKGQVSEIRSYDENNKLDQVTRFAYRWNSRGQIVEQIHYDDGQLSDRTQYEYNERADKTKETSLDDTGKISAIITRSFDEHHHVLLETSSDTQRGSKAETSYAYTPDGQIRELTHFESGLFAYRATSTYDKVGQLVATETVVAKPVSVEMNLYGSCGDCGVYPGRSTFKHDADGRITEQIWFVDDQAVRFDSFSYDKHGNRLNAWVYRFDPGKTPPPAAGLEVEGKRYAVKWINGLPTTIYRYDSRGNWIEAITYTRTSADAEPKLESIRHRIIAYY